MVSGHLSWCSPVDRELLKFLNELVNKYNQYLEQTKGSDQLDINRDLQNIIKKLEKVLPTK